MSRFNRVGARPATGTSAIHTTGRRIPNALGGLGHERDFRSELALLATTNMVGKDTFHENAFTRDTRFAELVVKLAVADADEAAAFFSWLRNSMNMRSASIVGAVEAARAMIAAKLGGARKLIAAVLQRADEPGELIAYWTGRYGTTIPKPIKRGIADAVQRLYTEHGFLKYDTSSHEYNFGRVLNLTHPTARAAWQGTLYKYAIAQHRKKAYVFTAEQLPMVFAQIALRQQVASGDASVLLDTAALKAAGMTWQDALSLAGKKVDKAKLWEALWPTMGYMALLRNLRNMDEAGVSDEVAEQIAARLADPEQVARSKQFPFRFYQAYKAVTSLRWGHPLEKAVNHSLANVPALGGRTLIMVDQSPSMWPRQWGSSPQQHEGIENHDLAALFGSAVALRAANPTLVGYGRNSYEVPVPKGGSLLRLATDGFHIENYTDTLGATARHFKGHDRVVIVTDEQTQSHQYSSIDQIVPREVPVYVWNIGGYRVGSTATGNNRHTFGGLTDAAFQMIPLLEAGKSTVFPWQAQAVAA